MAVVMEFKVHEPDEEKSLSDTVKEALLQIDRKRYDTALFERGITKAHIWHYGFAFEGKRVQIGSDLEDGIR